jgi:7-cyano-7-deazaguanine tRNA-ribosyltransferase
MEFEVRETDLLGRIGRLNINGKSIETPCLFPVVHPVNQQVSIQKIKEMRFQGIMTNSYIAYKRIREKVMDNGIHRFLGFDGIIMTDSGGYQVLEYGDVDLSYKEIAEFQVKIGADLAVTLDKPTGDTTSRKVAERTVKTSLLNAVKTIREFRDRGTEWVGPIQGGLFPELLRRSAKRMIMEGFRILALGSPVQIMENYRLKELGRMIMEVRKTIPYSVPLHLFGAGHPLTVAFSVALGCDTFDSASYILFARQGRYMTESTVVSMERMEYFPCSCEICSKKSPSEIREMEHQERTELLAIHNLFTLRNEVLRTKQAIVEGRLWDLLHERASSHPSLMEAFIDVATESSIFVDETPVVKDRGLFVRSAIDFLRPEILSSKKMLDRSFKVEKDEATIFFEAPGKTIKAEIYTKLSEKFDVYRIHQCLGVYPSELDFVYPFTQTVISSSSIDKNFIQEQVEKLYKLGYKSVYLSWLEDKKLRMKRSGINRA